MILSDLRRYMKTHERVSLDDLALHFDGEKSAIEGMMEVLIARGEVVVLGCGSCGGAGGCAFAGPKIYRRCEPGTLQKQSDGSSVCRT